MYYFLSFDIIRNEPLVCTFPSLRMHFIIQSRVYSRNYAHIKKVNDILQMRPLKLITFDVTNTLIKVNVSPAYQYASMAKKLGMAVDESAVKEAYNTEWTNFRRQYPIYGALQGMTCTMWWHQFVYNVFNAAGYQGTQRQLREVAHRLHSEFPQRADFWRVLPGATSTLERLTRAGVQVAVLSNFDDRLDDVLRMLALRDYFGVVVTSVDAKYEKPSVEVFQKVLSECNVEAQDAVHIGDNLEEDYEGALNAGMSAILYDPSRKHIPFTHACKNRGFRIENLTEIFDTVRFENKDIKEVNVRKDGITKDRSRRILK